MHKIFFYFYAHLIYFQPMTRKTILFITALLLIFPLYSQNYPVYAIPSFGIPVSGVALFKDAINTEPIPVKGKRSVNISVRGTPSTQASVILYTLDGSYSLGPYLVQTGQTLTVEIDEREWGVMVNSEEAVQVDVWYSY